MSYFLKKTENKKGTYLQIYESYYDPECKCGAHRSYKPVGYVHELIDKGIDDPVSFYSNESVQLTPGKTVLINPYEPHEIQAGKGFMVGLFLQVSRHFCRDYFPYFSSITFEHQTFDDNIADLKDVIVKTALCYLEAKPLFEIELVSLVSNFLRLLIKHFKYYILDEHNHSIR